MGFDYLNNKNWKDISRDERRFCADLVFQLQTNNTQKEFIEWVIQSNDKLKDIKNIKRFEIDFEVCFYRDLIFNYELNEGVKLQRKAAIKGLLKRTFDIVVFLPDAIIIIEAKAAQGMTRSQMTEFNYDKEAIEHCFRELGLPSKKVYIVGLVSGAYGMKGTYDFDGMILWESIAKNPALKYSISKKLETVYLETTRNNGKVKKIDHRLIDSLKDLTERMQSERKKHKRIIKDIIE